MLYLSNKAAVGVSLLSPEGCARQRFAAKLFCVFKVVTFKLKAVKFFSVPFQVAFSIVSAEVGT